MREMRALRGGVSDDERPEERSRVIQGSICVYESEYGRTDGQFFRWRVYPAGETGARAGRTSIRGRIR